MSESQPDSSPPFEWLWGPAPWDDTKECIYLPKPDGLFDTAAYTIPKGRIPTWSLPKSYIPDAALNPLYQPVYRRAGEQPVTALDLFCGAGGASCGMHMAGYEVVAGVDQDRDALQSYNESLPGKPVHHDLRDVDISALPRDGYHVVHISPPCQGFSQARGELDLDAEENEMVWVALEWLQALRPPLVTMENVVGMSQIDTAFMDELTAAFDSVGYNMRWKVINSADYGVPQERRRIICIGLRHDLRSPGIDWFPTESHSNTAMRSLVGDPVDEYQTASDAIGDLPSSPRTTADDPTLECPTIEGYPLADEMSPLHDDTGDLSTQRRVVNHIAPDHDPEVKRRHTRIPRGETVGSVTECRLARDEPARTICGSKGTSIVHYEGDDSARRLTVRETARLQGFPDTHVFVGSRQAQYQQVANAVPPQLMAEIACHLPKLLCLQTD
jgi:DNA (cytosine-5)-methyltransferase 1